MGDCSAFIKKFRISFTAFSRLIGDDSGQAVTEYILILSITVGLTATFSRKILTGINKGVQALGAGLEQQLKTGRVSISVWKN